MRKTLETRDRLSRPLPARAGTDAIGRHLPDPDLVNGTCLEDTLDVIAVLDSLIAQGQLVAVGEYWPFLRKYYRVTKYKYIYVEPITMVY